MYLPQVSTPLLSRIGRPLFAVRRPQLPPPRVYFRFHPFCFVVRVFVITKIIGFSNVGHFISSGKRNVEVQHAWRRSLDNFFFFFLFLLLLINALARRNSVVLKEPHLTFVLSINIARNTLPREGKQ
jgi:hypothetical protein